LDLMQPAQPAPGIPARRPSCWLPQWQHHQIAGRDKPHDRDVLWQLINPCREQALRGDRAWRGQQHHAAARRELM
jgi:hypothetical protein